MLTTFATASVELHYRSDTLKFDYQLTKYIGSGWLLQCGGIYSHQHCIDASERQERKKMSDRAGEKFVCIVFRVNFIIRTVWQRRFEVIQYAQQCSWILSQVARFTANGWIWRTRNILLANFKRYLDKKKRKNRNNNKIYMKRKRMTTASSTFLLINYFN